MPMGEIMNELTKAKELLDKNRLLVAISVGWLIVSNLLYFSQIDRSSCFSITTFAGSSDPDWMILWNKLTLGYVSLYQIASANSQPGGVICSQAGFSEVGYSTFVSLPILIVILLAIATKWVRRA